MATPSSMRFVRLQSTVKLPVFPHSSRVGRLLQDITFVEELEVEFTALRSICIVGSEGLLRVMDLQYVKQRRRSERRHRFNRPEQSTFAEFLSAKHSPGGFAGPPAESLFHVFGHFLLQSAPNYKNRACASTGAVHA